MSPSPGNPGEGRGEGSVAGPSNNPHPNPLPAYRARGSDGTAGSAMATLAQLNISPGGMPKLPIDSANVTRDGVDGDWQKNRKYHGGADRAICIFSEENYAWLKREHGIDLENGSIGENFT